MAAAPAPTPVGGTGRWSPQSACPFRKGRSGDPRAHQPAAVLNLHAPHPRGKCSEGLPLLPGGACSSTSCESAPGGPPLVPAAPGCPHGSQPHQGPAWGAPLPSCSARNSFPGPLRAGRRARLTLSPRRPGLCRPSARPVRCCGALLRTGRSPHLWSGRRGHTPQVLCLPAPPRCFSVPLDLVTTPLSYQVTDDSLRGRFCSAGDLLGATPSPGCFPEPPDLRLRLWT